MSYRFRTNHTEKSGVESPQSFCRGLANERGVNSQRIELLYRVPKNKPPTRGRKKIVKSLPIF